MKFKRYQVVVDELGNLYAVVKDRGEPTVLVESVATKECFLAPRGSLALVPGLRPR